MPFWSRAPKDFSIPNFPGWGKGHRVELLDGMSICVPITFEQTISDNEGGVFQWQHIPTSADIDVAFPQYTLGELSLEMTTEAFKSCFTFESIFENHPDATYYSYPETPVERLRVCGYDALRISCFTIITIPHTDIVPDPFSMPMHIEVDASGTLVSRTHRMHVAVLLQERPVVISVALPRKETLQFLGPRVLASFSIT